MTNQSMIEPTAINDGYEELRLPAARRQHILRKLSGASYVTIAGLSHELGVSEMTIRRDLSELELAGLAERVRGGARPLGTDRRHPLVQRSSAQAAEKSAIGRAALALIKPGDILALDNGSTVTCFAEQLRNLQALTIITPSLSVVTALGESPDIHLMVCGGQLARAKEMTLVGTWAEMTFERVKVDHAILGCGGLSADRGCTHHDVQEVEVRKAMIRSASRVTLLADHTKFEREAFVSLGPLSLLDTVVTDAEPPAELREALRDAGVELLIAEDV